ncbi:hypothetical protein VIGAN_05237100, partial [Vigna angularis var. angularis]
FNTQKPQQQQLLITIIIIANPSPGNKSLHTKNPIANSNRESIHHCIRSNHSQQSWRILESKTQVIVMQL